MLRDLIDRFAYRYRLWAGETRGEKVGAGEAPPEVSARDEPTWRLILRFLWGIGGGVMLLFVLGRIGARALPAFGDFILMASIFLAVIWCAVGLFMMGGELLTKYSNSDSDDKSI